MSWCGSSDFTHFADELEKAIMYATRSLTPTECNYSQVEKEALALIFAVKKYHKMLFKRCFTLLTDPEPLLLIFGLKKRTPVYLASRLRRWAIILLGYDFENLVRLMLCHASSVCNQSQITTLASMPSTQRTIFSAHSLIVSEQFLWQKWRLNEKPSATQWYKKFASFSDIHGFPHLTGDLQQFKQRGDSLSVIDEYDVCRSCCGSRETQESCS